MTQWQDPRGGQSPATPPQWQQPGAPVPYVPAPQPSWQPQPYGQQPYPQVAPKSPALGLIVSIFLPGVGSMMAGRAGKGIGILAGYLIGWMLCLILIGFLIMPAFWIWGMAAAHGDAVAWNRDHGIVS